MTAALLAVLLTTPGDPPRGLALPKGTTAVAVEFAGGAAANGFIGPGARVDLLATLRIDNKIKAFPIWVSVLVVAVDTVGDAKGGVTKVTITFAVDKDEAVVLALAKARGCNLMPMLRGPDDGDPKKGFDIKKVAELLGTVAEALPVAPPPRAK